MNTIAETETGRIKFTRDELLVWLADQIQTLIGFGYHTNMGKTVDSFMSYILATAGRQIPEFLEVGDDRPPLLLVIPDGVLSFEIQLKLLDIQSDHIRPIWDIEGITIPNSSPFPAFGVKYMRSMIDVPLETIIESSRHQDITFAEGLAMIAQFDELREHCEGLVIAGSYWYVSQVKCAAVYSCLNGKRKITGRPTKASYCGCDFGLRESQPIVSFTP